MDITNWQIQLRKGLFDLVVLNLLRQGRCHGYEMVQRLKQIDGFEIREGNIYPVLARLATDGLVTSRTEPSRDGPPRKYFELTSEGKKALDAMNSHWNRINGNLQRLQTGDQ